MHFIVASETVVRIAALEARVLAVERLVVALAGLLNYTNTVILLCSMQQ